MQARGATAEEEELPRAATADASLPRYAWVRQFHDIPDTSRFRPATPGLMEALTLIPLALRMSSYCAKERREGRDPIFDLDGLSLQPPVPGPYAGVPLGGLGGGCIGRGFRGEFRRWNVHPGRYRHQVVHADQFSVRVKRGDTVHAQVLSVEDGSASENLKGWTWGMPGKKGTYHALYPRAWTVYEEAVPGVRLTCRQVSPVIPHDYKDASLPAAVFVWTVENLLPTPCQVSIMFSFQNGTGSPNDKAGGHYNRAFALAMSDDEGSTSKVVGVQLHHLHRSPKAPVKPGQQQQPAGGAAGARGGKPAAVPIRGMEVMERCASDGGSRTGGAADHATCVCGQCDNNTRGGGTAVLKAASDGSLPVCCLQGGAGLPRASPHPQFPTGNVHVDPLNFAIAADVPEGSDVDVSVMTRFLTAGPPGSEKGPGSATDVWQQFLDNGRLHDSHLRDGWNDHTGSHPDVPVFSPEIIHRSAPGEALGAALCQTVSLEGGSSPRTVRFSLTWDMPVVRFGGGLALPRRYTRFFGKGAKAAPMLARYAFRKLPAWEAAITDWQAPVLDDPTVPAFYKHMLFNELYYMTDGGTIWTDSKGGLHTAVDPEVQKELEWVSEHLHPKGGVGSDEDEARLAEIFRTCHGDQNLIGQFMYLEGHEYLMYNTYDVHFYASFALAMLWPMLELSLQQDVAAAVMIEDLTMRRTIAKAELRPRKTHGSVPHDLGCPSGVPWREVNSYNLQDVNKWKDLGPKFVLQVYRDYVATSSRKFLEDMWPVVLHVMQWMQDFDTDGDGLIENSGFPDQTYDIWTVQGPSAYTGGLWVAALGAVSAMAELLGEQDPAKHYQALTDRARSAYVSRLWNGKYFNYDASASFHHDSIMADQMAGQWYTRACGLPTVVEGAMARSSLSTVYEFNVRKFADGMSGAVNGMRPDGRIDNTCMQSKEVWTGTTYSVAAAMLQEALGASAEAEASQRARELKEQAAFLRHAAFETARGLYEAGWKRLGFWFCTPEAWDQHGYYRSLGYMRPLCIWAMQWAMEGLGSRPVKAVEANGVASHADVMVEAANGAGAAATPTEEQEKEARGAVSTSDSDH